LHDESAGNLSSLAVCGHKKILKRNRRRVDGEGRANSPIDLLLFFAKKSKLDGSQALITAG
jgi:hypothetical protein